MAAPSREKERGAERWSSSVDMLTSRGGCVKESCFGELETKESYIKIVHRKYKIPSLFLDSTGFISFT